jgi:hypothetical protein
LMGVLRAIVLSEALLIPSNLVSVTMPTDAICGCPWDNGISHPRLTRIRFTQDEQTRSSPPPPPATVAVRHNVEKSYGLGDLEPFLPPTIHSMFSSFQIL